MDHLTWRRGTAEDEPLLFRLFAASKAEELAPLGWPEQQLRPLLEMQFRARQQSYAQTFPAAIDTILCLEDGTPVGRHLIERQANCYRSIDLSILPGNRNRGIGTWALRQIQQLAALESVTLRLRVQRTNPALRLYERVGFIRVSSDELSYEMEWRSPQAIGTGAQPDLANDIVVSDGIQLDREEVLSRIFAFLREIGLKVHFGPVASNSFLPGIQMVAGGLRVDTDALLYPGDLLHEAGHLAVMSPIRRLAEFPSSNEPAEEMAALAWSYAAALQAGIPAEVVFHEKGYRGHAKELLQGFATGNCTGLPYLWWIGLTTQPLPGSPSIFPRMLRWLRESSSETQQVAEDLYSSQVH